MRELTDSNFAAEVLESSKPVLVEFCTTWCGPCITGMKNLKKFAAETGCKTGKLNLQKNPKMLWEYAPNGLPFYILFISGEPVKRAKGIVNLFDEFESLI